MTQRTSGFLRVLARVARTLTSRSGRPTGPESRPLAEGGPQGRPLRRLGPTVAVARAGISDPYWTTDTARAFFCLLTWETRIQVLNDLSSLAMQLRTLPEDERIDLADRLDGPGIPEEVKEWLWDLAIVQAILLVPPPP